MPITSDQMTAAAPLRVDNIRLGILYMVAPVFLIGVAIVTLTGIYLSRAESRQRRRPVQCAAE